MTAFDQWWLQQNTRRLFGEQHRIFTTISPHIHPALGFQYNETDTDDPYENNVNEFFHTGSLLVLIVIYGIVILGGVLGNASLVLTLCSASSVRLRNPLLLALCLADLLVAGLSAPITILKLALSHRATWSISTLGCKGVYYVQAMPVAASTLSLFMLSLDRYATVKHPRLAQLRQHRYLHITLSICTWVVASLLCLPIYFAYTAKTFTSVDLTNEAYVTCLSDYGSAQFRTYFAAMHTLFVFLLPGIGVLLNHYGVRRKLCALSLTARAAHGELPLPMPILRRPTHVIIVTGIANANRVVDDGSSEEDDDESPIPMADCSLMRDTVVKMSSPVSPRAMREIRAHQQRQRIGANAQLAATPGIPLPQTSTLRSRRRLGNMLIASAVIFIGCWAPHVFCVVWTEFGNKQYCSKTMSHFNLLLGYMHSAINPVIYWALNHNSLRQSPCAPFMRLHSVHEYFRKRFRSPPAPPPASSTNEAALGAFNPKYIRTTPKQYRAQASSHYLY